MPEKGTESCLKRLQKFVLSKDNSCLSGCFRNTQ
jgi:hypothetical protein